MSKLIHNVYRMVDAEELMIELHKRQKLALYAEYFPKVEVVEISLPDDIETQFHGPLDDLAQMQEYAKSIGTTYHGLSVGSLEEAKLAEGKFKGVVDIYVEPEYLTGQ